MMRYMLVLALLSFHTITVRAQFARNVSPYAKWGKIGPEDLQQATYSIDSNAKAVILADIGSARIVGNNKGFFSYIFKHHRVVHILSKAAFDLADVEITTFRAPNGAEEKFEGFRAVTYNLEGGRVVQSAIGKEAVMKEALNKRMIRRKFTLPNVKEGSIIEYEYETQSDFYARFNPWAFQGNYPRLWSEYSISVPYFMNYAAIAQGYLPFSHMEEKQTQEVFSISNSANEAYSGRNSFSATVNNKRWVMENVPVLKEEPFTSTLDNYISKIEFRLSEFKHPLPYERVMKTWPDAIKELSKDEDFGAELTSANSWISDELKSITGNGLSPVEQARRIHAWLRDSFSCTDHDAMYASQKLRSTFRSRKGNVADINLLLTAMLRGAGLEAHPAILSTRENGVTHPLYPLLDRYNYVVCRVLIDTQAVWLDASRPRIGFGRLPAECYNGDARLVSESMGVGFLYADSLLEKKETIVFVASLEDKYSINVKQQLGYTESSMLRSRLAERGEGSFWKEIEQEHPTGMQLQATALDSLTLYDAPLLLRYSFQMDRGGEDLLYVNPVMVEGYKENPFKSGARIYPVEMPYAWDETYHFTFQIPDGYAVDELPKSVRVALNEQREGMFEYLITHSGRTISMRSRIKIDRAMFDPEEYELLRGFFDMIVSKQGESIVLKKTTP